MVNHPIRSRTNRQRYQEVRRRYPNFPEYACRLQALYEAPDTTFMEATTAEVIARMRQHFDSHGIMNVTITVHPPREPNYDPLEKRPVHRPGIDQDTLDTYVIAVHVPLYPDPDENARIGGSARVKILMRRSEDQWTATLCPTDW